MGEAEQLAPELRVRHWIGQDGSSLSTPLKLSDLGKGPKILFAFQDWCAGCHAHGFPTLQRLHSALAPRGVGFAAIQTVFEGEHENTLEKLRINQEKYDLPIPFGHDAPPAGKRLPFFMEDYRSGGTPWFTIIDTDGRIVFQDFHLDPDSVLAALVVHDGATPGAS